MAESQNIQAFVQAELARLTQQREAAMAAKGMLPFMAVPVGETIVKLQAKIPGDYDGGGGNIKKLFTVVPRSSPFLDSDNTQRDDKWVAGKEYSWPINPKSPTYRDTLELLVKAPLDIKIVRVGKGKQDTRYTIAPAT